WPFDKFPHASRRLGTQMKATGEVMAIASSFEGAMMKAIRSLELNVYNLRLNKLGDLSDDEIAARLHQIDDERIFVVTEALRRGMSPEEINAITKIDTWFLDRFRAIVQMEQTLAEGRLDAKLLREAKEMGFGDAYIGELCNLNRKTIKHMRQDWNISPTYKMVDTCAAEYDAATPYYYSGYDMENESRVTESGKKRVLVLGSGPIRIGQGIEFDYCSVHSVWALKRLGCETIIVNNNPETVSTDFDVADRLYFEPLTPEDVENIVEIEKPWGAVVQFGGQTAIKLAKALNDMGVPILGTSSDGVDAAEDRERFDAILRKLHIPRAEGRTVFTTEEAVAAANEIGYPVLVRPSYVLGGQGMEIAYSDRNITEYMKIINRVQQEHPILIDKYLMGREVEVDGVFDGKDLLFPGIMEHVERAGVHSGDSISVYPPLHVEDKHKKTILEYTKALSEALGVIGLVNIQFVIYNDTVYVIEVNPRSSRTIPYISKVTGVPIIDLATKVILGEKLADLGYGTGIYPEASSYAVKMPVFSFEKLTNVDTSLGPEMKSTGEVLGIAETFPQALLKAFKGAKMRVPSRKKGGRVILTVKDEDKGEVIGIARRLAETGITLYATSGTCSALENAGIPVQKVNRVSESSPNILDLIASGTVDLIVNTPTKGRKQDTEGFKIRRYAVEHSVSCVTSIDTASAIVTTCIQGRSEQLQAIDLAQLSK
ncbi:MAG: carbamoyl-phosphate synthase large subunit, partial [Oscillospiraceae bacterium]|nr:carbamoyl-phosphate synthase large subunit [Oscillospiraceae bacterium]